MANRHELKTWPTQFRAIRAREINFTIRLNNRDFQVGDTLVFQEWDPAAGEYTGAVEERRARGLQSDDDGTIHGHVGIAFEDVGPAVEISIDGTLTRDGLAAWHRRHAEAAAQRAANNRQQASAHPRYAAVADAGDAEAGFHAAAALIVAGSAVAAIEETWA